MKRATWQEVLDFWFDPEHIPLQFEENNEFDEKIRANFLDTWKAASEGLLVEWRENVRGRLAEIIVLDQFSRNLWREDIRTYTQDKMAIALAQELVTHPLYGELEMEEKHFAVLPFMHSESLELHDWAMPYYEQIGDEDLLWFERKHREVLEKFGRYPYQNDDLGRESTPEEIEILKEKKGHFYDKEK